MKVCLKPSVASIGSVLGISWHDVGFCLREAAQVRKSAEAFRTISEVAEELNVPKHVLRFWEIKFPQIRPMKRGGGRRYYRPEDIELLSGIRRLLHADRFTIKGVQKILKEQSAEYVKAYGRGEAPNSLNAVVSSKASPVAGAKTKKTAAKQGRPRKTAVPPSDIHDTIIKAISQLELCRENLKKVMTKPAL